MGGAVVPLAVVTQLINRGQSRVIGFKEYVEGQQTPERYMSSELHVGKIREGEVGEVTATVKFDFLVNQY